MSYALDTDMRDRLAQAQRELAEARELQAASAEVLRVISSSPGDVRPVFDMIAESAVRLCEGQFCFVFRLGADLLHLGACHGLTPEGLEAVRRALPMSVGEETASGRAILRRAVCHIPDVLAEPGYALLAVAQAVTYRSIVAVPMLHDGHPVGAISVARSHAGPFSDAQIGLLQTFADQAVIAIENVRLFDAEQQRTHELSEALDQQTATSEVLQVISRSAFDLQTVLDTLVASAARLCGTKHCMIFRHEDGFLRAAAAYNTPRELLELWERTPMPAGRGTATARALLERRPVHIPDVLCDPEYDFHEAQRVGAYRTVLAVPLLRDGMPFGTMVLWKTEVEPFTHKQIELVTTFADQAVIAIENVRLFDAEQQRTRELTASLQQQTATADVLKVISRSAFDLETVLNTLVESAARLCDAYDAVITLREGDHSLSGPITARSQSDFVKFPVTRTWTAGRAVIDRTAVHVHDLTAAGDEFPDGRAIALRLGQRTIFCPPVARRRSDRVHYDPSQRGTPIHRSVRSSWSRPLPTRR